MRHLKHRHKLGVKTAHRAALLASLASALIRHKRIQTTLAKAKALRPYVEQVITLAKKAAAETDSAKKLHFRRLALARLRDQEALAVLFNERAEEFTGREGGYTRIYKLAPRLGDGAEVALVELIDADDEGYPKRKKKAASGRKTTKKKAKAAEAEDAAPAEDAAVEEAPAEEVSAEEVSAEEAPAEEPTTGESETEKKD